MISVIDSQLKYATPTKRLVKTAGLFGFTGLRKVQKCVFFVYNFEKGKFDPIFGIFSAQ